MKEKSKCTETKQDINPPNKFESLNFNLKNEIMRFLPVFKVINELSLKSKKFLFAVNNLKYVKNNESLLKNSDFTKSRIL